MRNSEFPIKNGFIYNSSQDEFYMPFEDGMLILCEKVHRRISFWELSYVDKEDYQNFLKKGTESEVMDHLVQFFREKKINDILS